MRWWCSWVGDYVEIFHSGIAGCEYGARGKLWGVLVINKAVSAQSHAKAART
jgi:hypothetical protein